MNMQEAIKQACASVGIVPPKSYAEGRWSKTDTLSGKNGKGDGRIFVDVDHVVAWNHQTGQHQSVRLKDDFTPAERKQAARRREDGERKKRERTRQAAAVAAAMAEDAKLSIHPYLAAKGFREEKALVLDAATVGKLGGDYLIAGERAIVVPARIGKQISSVQLIWEDGTKKFLFGGEIGGASHRIAKGTDTWHCEGYATGLTLRAALKDLRRSDTILCCFSAGNVAAVARAAKGRAYIVTDNDKPMPQFDGLGTGEYWARQSGRPYVMPPELGDINDLHQGAGIFAVQRLLTNFLRELRM